MGLNWYLQHYMKTEKNDYQLFKCLLYIVKRNDTKVVRADLKGSIAEEHVFNLL